MICMQDLCSKAMQKQWLDLQAMLLMWGLVLQSCVDSASMHARWGNCLQVTC